MHLFRQRMVGLGLAIAWLLGPVSGSAQPPNTTYYAAIAFSKTSGKYGYTSGWLAESNARRDALARCDAPDAKVILVVGNGYAALAVGDDIDAYGYGYSEDPDEAKQYALESCQERTTGCRIVVLVHSWAG